MMNENDSMRGAKLPRAVSWRDLDSGRGGGESPARATGDGVCISDGLCLVSYFCGDGWGGGHVNVSAVLGGYGQGGSSATGDGWGAGEGYQFFAQAPEGSLASGDGLGDGLYFGVQHEAPGV